MADQQCITLRARAIAPTVRATVRAPVVQTAVDTPAVPVIIVPGPAGGGGGAELVLAPNSGLILDEVGLRIDLTQFSRRRVFEVTPSPASPYEDAVVTIAHGLGTEDIAVTVRNSYGSVVLVPWNSDGTPDEVRLTFGPVWIDPSQGLVADPDTYRVRIDG